MLSGPVAASDAPSPRASISDAAHNGTAGFYFLPPLVAEPHDTAHLDAGRKVTVQVCPLGNPAAGSCIGPAILVSPAAVDVNGNHYQVNWQTDVGTPWTDTYYRISVVDDGTTAEWGHVDVYLGSTGKGFRGINQAEFTPLLDGRTVPVKFRIGVGAQAPAAGSSPGTGGTPGGSYN